MATYSLTIGGVAQPIRGGTLRLAETVNGRNTFECEVVSWNGAYRPAQGVEVLYLRDSARVFGGILDAPAERGLLPNGGRALVNRVAAVDFNSLAERRYVYETIPAGTLKSHLVRILSYLTIFGVTLDPAQVDGPAVPERIHNLRLLRECLDELSTLTGYVWELDYYRVLRMYLPGSLTAPFNVNPAVDRTKLYGDVTVEKIQTEYANRIIVLAGTGIREQTELFIGDGSTRVFPLSVPMAGFPRVSETNVFVTVGVYGEDTHLEWTYRASDNAVVQLAEAPTGTFHAALSSAEWVGAVYPGQAPYVVTAEDAAEIITNGPWEKVVEEPDVWDTPTAQMLADAYLAEAIQPVMKVSYTTRTRGVAPGQTQTITIPSRAQSGGTFLITDVRTTDTPGQAFSYNVTAMGGTKYRGSWRDMYRQWASTGSRGGPASSVSSGGGGGGAAVVLSSPVSLGGSRSLSVASTPAAWLPVREYRTFLAQGSFSGRVRADTWALNAGVTVTLRLYNLTDSTTAAASLPVTAITATTVMFNVAIVIGKLYRLEVLSSVAGQGVFGIGDLESA